MQKNQGKCVPNVFPSTLVSSCNQCEEADKSSSDRIARQNVDPVRGREACDKASTPSRRSPPSNLSDRECCSKPVLPTSATEKNVHDEKSMSEKGVYGCCAVDGRRSAMRGRFRRESGVVAKVGEVEGECILHERRDMVVIVLM